MFMSISPIVHDPPYVEGGYQSSLQRFLKKYQWHIFIGKPHIKQQFSQRRKLNTCLIFLNDKFKNIINHDNDIDNDTTVTSYRQY